MKSSWDDFAKINQYLVENEIFALQIEVDDVVFNTKDKLGHLFDCKRDRNVILTRTDKIDVVFDWLSTIPEILKYFYVCRELDLDSKLLLANFPNSEIIEYDDPKVKLQSIPLLKSANVDIKPYVLKNVPYRIIIDNEINKGITGPRLYV